MMDHRTSSGPASPSGHRSAENDARFINCEVCQTEGRLLTNDGGPDDVDHGVCPECNGDRCVEIETQPIELEDLIVSAPVEPDSGMLHVIYEKTGDVTVTVRSPHSLLRSAITLPLADFQLLIGGRRAAQASEVSDDR